MITRSAFLMVKLVANILSASLKALVQKSFVVRRVGIVDVAFVVHKKCYLY